MRCPLPATAKRVAKSVGTFLIDGAIDGAYKRSLGKRIAPPSEPRYLDIVGHAAGQPAVDLQEPFASSVPNDTTPHVSYEDLVRNATRTLPRTEITRHMSALDHNQNSTIVIPNQCLQGIIILFLFGFVLRLLVANDTIRARAQVAGAAVALANATAEERSAADTDHLKTAHGLIEALEVNADDLRRQCVDANAEAETLTAQLGDIRKDAQKDIARIKRQRNQTLMRVVQVKTRNKTLRYKVMSIKAKVKPSALRSARLASKARDNSRKEERKLEGQKSSITKELVATRSKSKADSKAQQSTISDQKKTTSDLQKAEAGLKESLKKEKQEKEQSQGRVSTLTGQVSSLSTDKTKLERDNKILRTALEQSQSREALSGWEIVALNGRVTELEKANDDLTTTLASTKQEKSDVAKELQAAETNAKKAVDALGVEKELNAERQRKAADDIHQANTKAEQESSRAGAAEQENASLIVQLATSADLKKQLEDVQLDFTRERGALQHKAATLQKDIWIV